MDGVMPRTSCDCGSAIVSFGTGANWGDFRCSKCDQPYCQDCGSPIGADGQCNAAEALRAGEEMS